jgi:hypothetical protein
MRFKVPQFIDVEDKIFGPFTFKQFIYLLGGAGICFVLYKTLPFLIAILFIIPVGGIAAALTFYQVNGKPFIFILEASVKYFFQNKLYLWKKAPKKNFDKKPDATTTSTEGLVPHLSDSKLKDISWSLDILDTKKRE